MVIVSMSICNNTTFTEINDFATEPWRFNGYSSKIGADNSYLEINNSWYFNHHKSKYYTNINVFFNDFYVNPPHQEYIRFSPGGCYIIPKENMLKYNKLFYEKIKEILGWDIVIGEAHMIERALYTIFNSEFEIKEEYKNKERSN